MRKVSGSMRVATPQYASGVNRYLRPTTRAVAGVGGLVLCTILFWYIFYQNLPPNLGLNRLPSDLPVTPSNGLDRFMKVCMIVVGIYVIASRWRVTHSLAKYINPGAAAVVVLAGLSAIWSIAPDETLLRFTTLAAIVLICFANSLAGWHPRRFQQLTIPPLMFILIA